ncbi:MAG: aspartate 4-decarboxylase [Muribaculaceae bacterium]|nr:aspartate 4-decarboxylase [Muribaculaceae bacterium]
MDNQNSCDRNIESRSCEEQLSALSPFELKNKLIELAEDEAKASARVYLNAGRGNPNWIASTPRAAFFLLGKFAMPECERVFTDPLGIAGSPLKNGIGERFEKFLADNANEPGAKLLKDTLEYLVKKGADREAVIFEWVDGIIGDHYPTPDRILKFTELLVRDYLAQEMGDNAGDAQTYDLFATEGGTAGMCYAFDSIQANHLIKKGEKMALMVPAFTPYIEIPSLDRFSFDVVNISANKVDRDGYHEWQYPDEEVNKLRDPSIKLLCITNPSNPPSYTLSRHTLDLLIDIVKHDNPNLMIVTDDVYGTFVNDFHSLMYELPHNTMCVYSFSKYFGATGWRLAVIALNQDNVFDKMLSTLPESDKANLNKRYGSLAVEPEKIKFIDRMVADSRLVALNHTAGLSTPQQIQMSLFAAMSLLDTEQKYKAKMQSIIHKRLAALWKNTGFTLLPDPLRAGYYSEIDFMVWAKKFYGDDFANWLVDNYNPLDLVIKLSHNQAVVLLNGDGFDGPAWSVRASLANLDEESYLQIGTAIHTLLEEYHDAYMKSHK